MGIGKHNPEDNNKETENTLSPLTLGDPEKAAHNDKPEFSSPHTNGVTEEDAYYLKQGYLQKLRSIKVRLVPLLIMAIIILAISISVVAVVAYKSGEKSTTDTVKPVYSYAECENDWIYYRGKCYYFSNDSDTWKNSQNYCESKHSSLAIIDSKEELNFLNLLKFDYWIGLSRTQDDSSWIWTNGTVYLETTFTISRKIPRAGDSEHVYQNGNGFKSDGGRYTYKWICSKKFSNHSP